MFGSVGDWGELFKEAYKALKPGGFLECAEHSVTPVSDDGTVGPDHVYTRYGTIINDLARKRGKESDVWSSLKERVKGADFVDVVETRTKWPMNGWSSDPKMRELGRWNQLRVTQGIEGFALRMLTAIGGVLFTGPDCLNRALTLDVVVTIGSAGARSTDKNSAEGQDCSWIS
jgi:hypothetical protein